MDIAIEEWITLRVCIRGIIGTCKLLWLIKFVGPDDDQEPDRETQEEYNMCRAGSGPDYDPLREVVRSLQKKGLISLYSCVEPNGEMTEVTDESQIKEITDSDGTWKKEPKAGQTSYYITSTQLGDEVMNKIDGRKFRGQLSRL